MISERMRRLTCLIGKHRPFYVHQVGVKWVETRSGRLLLAGSLRCHCGAINQPEVYPQDAVELLPDVLPSAENGYVSIIGCVLLDSTSESHPVEVLQQGGQE